MKFFSFWRSQASFRVRIALNLKRLPADVVFVDLDAGAHHDRRLSQGQSADGAAGAGREDGTTLFQSLAILEYLEETHPEPGCCRRTRPAARGCARWH